MIYYKWVKMLMDYEVLFLEDIWGYLWKIVDIEEICFIYFGKNVEVICYSYDKLCCMDCVIY